MKEYPNEMIETFRYIKAPLLPIHQEDEYHPLSSKEFWELYGLWDDTEYWADWDLRHSSNNNDN
jgi:hypothetical protein